MRGGLRGPEGVPGGVERGQRIWAHAEHQLGVSGAYNPTTSIAYGWSTPIRCCSSREPARSAIQDLLKRARYS